MKKLLTLLVCLFLLFSSLNSQDLAKYVNPFIGTGGHGHTYPGASMPFGMMQLSPDTRLTGWDGCSGYHFSDSIIYGFSHTHLSGTGCSDYGDILLMPLTGDISWQGANYSSGFSHSNEKAEPGFYKVLLDKHNILAELTATKRAGFHKYTFNNKVDKTAYIILDLKHRDYVIDSKIKIIDKNLISGYRFSKAWANNQKIYFAIRFSQPMTNHYIFENDSSLNFKSEASGKNLKAAFGFDLTLNSDKCISPTTEKCILIKIGISAVSEENALKNLDTEIPDWSFKQIKEQARAEWNKELCKIVVEGGTEQQKTAFYSALYHSMLNPNLYSDVDGRYRGRDDKIHSAAGFDYYTVFSLWDTYRAEHPLLSIIDTKRTNDFINTFLAQWEQGGLLPVWELSANETNCMIGYHAVPVIADALVKGIKGYDVSKTLKACITSADKEQFGIGYIKKYGFIPSDMESESVSRTLEYSYDDWCIAQIAKTLNEQKEYVRFIRRAQGYKNIFDKNVGFMRGRFNGGWSYPFDPTEVNSNYTEANAWQYSFYVPQDVSTLIKLYGGEDKFSAKLDEMFSTSSKTSGREQADITGLIGQYAHGNEPSHHMAYLYNYSGKPWKTQEIVRKIMDELYSSKEDGLCGNEDCGQMSAWYVLSAMGFYPVCPGQKEYAIGTPLFDKITLNLENGKKFVITADKPSSDNFYIKSARLNGKDYDKCFITHDDITNSGELKLKMSKKPVKSWASSTLSRPKTEITDREPVLAPVILSAQKSFHDKLNIEISTFQPDSKVYYTLDGSEPTQNSKKYESSIIISNNCTVKAISVSGNEASPAIEAHFFKIQPGRTIKIKNKYASMYSAGGDEALIDGIRGNPDFHLGGWQGYDGVDFEATVDLGVIKELKKITAGFLQDVTAWIMMPKEVEIFGSTDGETFQSLSKNISSLSDRETKPTIMNFSVDSTVKVKFIKIKAKNYGLLPEWHLGAGGKSWIFIDEIEISEK